MNKKELHETDQAIEMTARALGELETNSAQPSANGDSASHLAVEFEQVRELGRVIRDSSSHDTEQWVSPADAAQLKQLINAEFVSDKLVPADNTGQMRLAALAATILLMFGIGYVLLRTPPATVSDVARLEDKEVPGTVVVKLPGVEENPEAEILELAGALESTTDAISDIRAGIERMDRNTGVSDLHNTKGVLESQVQDAQDKLRSDLAAANKALAEKDKQPDAAPERNKAGVEIQSGTIVGDFAAGSVEAGKFDQQGLASDPSLKLERLQLAEQLAGNPAGQSSIPADESQVPGEKRSRRGGDLEWDDAVQLIESDGESGFVLQDGQILLGDGVPRIVDLPQSGSELAKGMQETTGAVPELAIGGGDSKSKFSFYNGVLSDHPSQPPVIDPNGTTVPLPRFAETKTTTTVTVPDGGTVMQGGIKTQPASPGNMNLSGKAPIADAFTATPDLDIPFVQDSFGTTAPQFGGSSEGKSDLAKLNFNTVVTSDPGIDVDKLQFSGERTIRGSGGSDLSEILSELEVDEELSGDVQIKIVEEFGQIVLIGAPEDTEKVREIMKKLVDANGENRFKDEAQSGEMASAAATRDQKLSELNRALTDEYRQWTTVSDGLELDETLEPKLATMVANVKNMIANHANDSADSDDGRDSETLSDLQEQLTYLETRHRIEQQRLARISVLSKAITDLRADIDRDERPSNEQYELPPENQFLKPVAERALSTFSIDVDTASYANIRRFITSRQLPPGNAVRIEEMVNYFSYAYPQPVDGKPFSVSLDVAQCPWQPANKLVRVGIQGRDIPRDNRPASNLVFLIDVSGSMSDQNKLPLLQRSMLMLVDQLTENDRVSIVTYASNAGVRLQPTSGDQKQVIRDVINSLSSGGSTHGSAGITTAYELATQHFIEGGTNRVLLATDGDLNVGVTDDDSLVQLIKSKAESGVFLSVLGFGTGNLKDGKLEKIADNGNGQYCYIDSIREAQKILVAEMSGSLVTIAKDVKLQIEFNPAEVASYRLIGYENRALKNEDFANDRVDAGDIGAGHSVTALYEIVPVRAVNKPAPAPPSGLRYQNAQAVVVEQGPSVDENTLTDAARTGELMNVSLRFKRPESSESELLEVTVKDMNQSFNAAPADFKFAASVAAYGMKLRQSSYAGNWTWFDIENTAVSTIGDDPQGHRAELVDLVRQTRRMLGR